MEVDLSGGSFNGMEDIYEYREDELTTDEWNGFEILSILCIYR